MKSIKDKFFRRRALLASFASILFLLFSVVILPGCEKDKNVKGAPVYVDKPTVELMMGQTKVINLNREDGTKYVQKFELSSSNPEIATVI